MACRTMVSLSTNVCWLGCRGCKGYGPWATYKLLSPKHTLGQRITTLVVWDVVGKGRPVPKQVARRSQKERTNAGLVWTASQSGHNCRRKRSSGTSVTRKPYCCHDYAFCTHALCQRTHTHTCCQLLTSSGTTSDNVADFYFYFSCDNHFHTGL